MSTTLPIALLRGCLDQARHGITLADARQPDLPLIYVNEAFVSLTGYSREELLGRNCRLLQGDDRRQSGRTLLRQSIRQRRPGRAVLRNYRKDGSMFWNDLTLTPFFNSSGELTYYIGVQEDVTARRQEQARLLRYQHQLQALAHRLIRTEEVERQKIACEVHDQVGQTLSLCRIRLAELAQDTGGMSAHPALAAACGLVETAIQQTRELMAELSPSLLRELGLPAALQSLGEQLSVRYRVPVVVSAAVGAKPVREELEQMIYRSACELVVNAGKHASARSIQVNLLRTERHLVLKVSDDGRGFQSRGKLASAGGGFGLSSIRERAVYLGGTLVIRSRIGQGTQAVLRLTLAASRKPAKRTTG